MPFDANSKIREIAENPEAKAIFEKHLPGFFADPRSRQAFGLSLKVLVGFPQSKAIKEKLPQILEDFTKLK
jgi:hypothetical protein